MVVSVSSGALRPEARSWAHTHTLDVAPGVHRIPLPMPGDGLSAVNVYVLEAPDGLTLVDAGLDLPAARAALLAGLRELGATLGDITQFLVTHAHQDHYAQAVAIRREFGSRVLIGSGERAALEGIRASDQTLSESFSGALTGLGAHELQVQLGPLLGVETPGLFTWEMPDSWLQPGLIDVGPQRQLEAVATPGHTAGHMVFHDLDARLLFAGDHVLPTITPSLNVPALEGGSLTAFLRSLALLRSRPDAQLLPAHGPVTPSVHGRVDQLLEHHRQRLEEMLRSVQRGASNAYEVARAVRWTRHDRPFAQLDLLHGVMATYETAAHLDHLVIEGRLDVAWHEGVRCYLPSTSEVTNDQAADHRGQGRER